MSKIRIVIVEDDEIVRKSLSRALSAETEIEVIGEASNGNEAESIVQQAKPDIVILDVRLGVGQDGLELIPIIHHNSPESKILMISGFYEFIIQSIKVGASGFLGKPFEISDLTASIREAANGWMCLDSKATILLLKELNNATIIPNKQKFLDRFFRLNLSGQNLKKLPLDLLEFPNLSILDIRNNAFSELPSKLNMLPKLRQLIASDNQITGISQELRNRSDFEILDLRDNKINIPPEILERVDEPQVILDFYFTHLRR